MMIAGVLMWKFKQHNVFYSSSRKCWTKPQPRIKGCAGRPHLSHTLRTDEGEYGALVESKLGGKIRSIPR
jgi:hypothetical protein